MNIERISGANKGKHEEVESMERLHAQRAIIFVPGVTEGASIFDAVATQVRENLKEEGLEERSHGALQSARLYMVNTHDEETSVVQQEVSRTVPSPKSAPPIMSIISNNEKRHDTFEDRVQLVEKALHEAVTNDTKEVVLVGHSAGATATLAAVGREVLRRNELSEIQRKALPRIKMVLIAPAVPGDAHKILTLAPSFIKTMLTDFVKKAFSGDVSNAYLKQLVCGPDVLAGKKDLEELLGPFGDETYKDEVVTWAVPLPAKEARDLMYYPIILKGLDAQQWPEDITTTVFIPKNDKWVSPAGQTKLVKGALTKLMGNKVKGISVEGGHLPLGSDSDVTKLVANLVTEPER